MLSLSGNQLFPSDNPWNHPITDAPVAANSATLVSSIGATRPLHPDFGSGTYNGSDIGIPYNVVTGSQPKVNVVIDAYPAESDLVPVPIPANAVIEGDPAAPATNTGDRHLIVYDQTNNVAYELFNAHRPSEEPDNQWHADSEAVWNMNADSFRTPGYTSADAAGLPILPGLVRADEVLTQGAITHALRFTVQQSDSAYVYPASHEAGVNNPALPRMGERFRLNSNFDISGFSPADQIILQALKTYGMIVADNGSNWFISGAPSDQWNNDDLHNLTQVLGQNFQAVDLTPVVSGLDQASGSTSGGTTVTVHGVNFQGVAKNLQVSFGGVAGTNVNVLSDNTLTVTAPAHVATSVDVTVTTPYGTSAASSADTFTYVQSNPASASYVGVNTASSGSWVGTFGSDGYDVNNGSSSLPSYVRLSFSGASQSTWPATTTDSRALFADNTASSRALGAWYSTSSFSVDVNLTDGNSHAVSLYLLDWDHRARAESISAIDTSSGSVLNTQTLSNFDNGTYATWNLSGNVTLKVTLTGGDNAVVGGLFFGPPASAAAPTATAAFVKTDVTTSGSWPTAYGSDGYDVNNGASVLPSYAQISFTGQAQSTWPAASSDPRVLFASPNNTTRALGAWYSTTSFGINLNLSDGKTHAVSVYLLDWDHRNRAETINVLDAGTHALLDTRSFNGFDGGEYASWNLSGNVTLQVVLTGGDNAVVSGLFFGAGAAPQPTSTARFVAVDGSTSGSWVGAYGSDGYDVNNGGVSLPSYAQLSLSGASESTWPTTSTDSRVLESDPSQTSRALGAWYSTGTFNIRLNLTDGKTHAVSLYLLDWDHRNRAETINVIDTETGTVLNSQTFGAFGNGTYATWDLSGAVTLQVVLAGGDNAVVSGLFFDPAR